MADNRTIAYNAVCDTVQHSNAGPLESHYRERQYQYEDQPYPATVIPSAGYPIYDQPSWWLTVPTGIDRNRLPESYTASDVLSMRAVQGSILRFDHIRIDEFVLCAPCTTYCRSSDIPMTGVSLDKGDYLQEIVADSQDEVRIDHRRLHKTSTDGHLQVDPQYANYETDVPSEPYTADGGSSATGCDMDSAVSYVSIDQQRPPVLAGVPIFYDDPDVDYTSYWPPSGETSAPNVPVYHDPRYPTMQENTRIMNKSIRSRAVSVAMLYTATNGQEAGYAHSVSKSGTSVERTPSPLLQESLADRYAASLRRLAPREGSNGTPQYHSKDASTYYDWMDRVGANSSHMDLDKSLRYITRPPSTVVRLNRPKKSLLDHDPLWRTYLPHPEDAFIQEVARRSIPGPATVGDTIEVSGRPDATPDPFKWGGKAIITCPHCVRSIVLWRILRMRPPGADGMLWTGHRYYCSVCMKQYHLRGDGLTHAETEHPEVATVLYDVHSIAYGFPMYLVFRIEDRVSEQHRIAGTPLEG
ncbi:hypothetical protein PENSPDRAFT_671593 [Peniophora sp. CONT]|nr:hypothetical protein PENSPDRAFT_671593 [Peniophora sp. CONT]